MTNARRARIHAASFTMPRPWSESEIAALEADKFTFIEDSVNGFVVGRVIADEAELLTIAVDPAARRSGQGRALLSAFFEISRARGATTAFLEVAANNTGAIALYHAAGFVDSGRRRNYYRGPEGERIDALILQIAL